MNKYKCPRCKCNKFDKGRGTDGRRCYRCKNCGAQHSSGMQGRTPSYSKQRQGFQFHDTGAYRHGKKAMEEADRWFREHYPKLFAGN